MKNKIVVYSAIYGQKDMILDEQLILPGVDYILFTDDPLATSKTWEIRVVTPLFPKDPVRSAKQFKILPHFFLEEYDVSLWIDGNMQLVKDFRPQIDQLKETPMLFRKAAAKNGKLCVYQEAQHCIKLGKDNPKIINKQIDKYAKKGMPENFGLFGAGAILRAHNDKFVSDFNDEWWEHILFYSRRDQISLPYMIWRTKAKTGWIKEPIINKLKHLS